MKIPVIFADQRRGVVRGEELHELILSKKIVAFLRYYEWVNVNIDPIRGRGGRRYVGPERRGDLLNY